MLKRSKTLNARKSAILATEKSYCRAISMTCLTALLYRGPGQGKFLTSYQLIQF
jgi:hypothetical protein